LRERFIGDEITLKRAYFMDGLADPNGQMAEMTAHIRSAPIDVALIGIGENAHIAFNDPPADFGSREAFIVVDLDDACKHQQVREGWFASLSDVPKQAITMTPYQIMQSKAIVSAVPYGQKAEAVKKTMENDVTPLVPSTLLKTHPDWTLYLDADSAALIKKGGDA
jgi:glucosamine-6-phosphate deaminase